MSRSRTLALLFAAALGAACGGPPQTPEDEVRATIALGEAAVREHRVRALKDLIAADYRDAAGRDKAALEGILTAHFLRNSQIHLLVRIRALSVEPKGTATVEALVATAGRPIPGLEALAEVNADLLWLDLGLARRGGDWAVTHAHWERAQLEDLL